MDPRDDDPYDMAVDLQEEPQPDDAAGGDRDMVMIAPGRGQDTPLTPEAQGIPVVLGDGQTWHVARVGLDRRMSVIRDDIFSTWIISGGVRTSDTMGALWYGLAANYALSDAEIRALILCTDMQPLVEDLVDAVLPWPPKGKHFTAWARSALLANALDPDSIAPEDIPHVLAQLVSTGRAVAPEDYTDAGAAARKRAKLGRIAMALRSDKPPQPTAAPQPETDPIPAMTE